MTEPVVGRPHMPGYGIASGQEGTLPWDWARERLENTRNYFVSSTRPDGRPHVMPVWAIWLGGLLWFSTARASTKARNLFANPQISVAIERGDEAVIVEGTAAVEEDHDVLEPVWAAYRAKYEWDMTGESMFFVTPKVAFGFIESTEQFASTATRWRFD
ncbi:MAG TPA: pyridoxamine 5'-phosphate oxidase family protein [Dehalococcoidia bacterium]